MLLFASLAQAGVWNVCAATEATASVNAGWTIVEVRDADDASDTDKGVFNASSSVVRRFQPSREEDFCKATDGLGGATRRWTTEMISIDMVPGQNSCPTTIWGDAYGDTGSRASVEPYKIAGMATGHAVTTADAGNTGTISVDGGGGAGFVAEWIWQVPGSVAAVEGVIEIDDSSAYNGATLDIPGWAQVDAYDGMVDAWVRRGSEWVHLTGPAPMDIEFGANVGSRGSVCAAGKATSGSQAQPGEASAGGSGIHFTLDSVRVATPADAMPTDGPEFEPCGC